MKLKSKFIELRGLRIHYLTGGHGVPLLYIPGWAVTAEMNRKIGELLAENYKLYIIDTPGDGKSDQFIGNWQFKDYVLVVKEFIKKLNLNNIILLGHSFGGAIAICLIANNPEIFSKVFLANTIGITPDEVFMKYLKGRLKIEKNLSKILLDYIKNIFIPKFSDQLKALRIIKELYLSETIERIEKKVIFLWAVNDHILSENYKNKLLSA